jgi:glycosyltransferase involved in cell wall biosynthesis
METHITHLSLALRRAGAAVVLVVHPNFGVQTGNRDSLTVAGVRLVDLPTWPLNRLLRVIIQRVYVMCKFWNTEFDNVLAQGRGGSHLWLRSHLRTGGKFIWHDHLDGGHAHAPNDVSFKPPKYSSYPRPVRRVLEKADAVIIGSQQGKSRLQQLHGSKQSIHVLAPLQVVTAPLAQDRPFQCPFRFAAIGRLGDQKGVSQLLSLWKSLDLPDAELHLYGDDPDGRYNTEALRLGAPNLYMHGPYTPCDLPKIMEVTDIGLVTSLFEGYPLTSLEFMAYGVPFVMTAVGAAEEMAKGNPDIVVAEISDAGMAGAIHLMLERGRMGQLSRKRLHDHYLQNFAHDKLADRYVELVCGTHTGQC